MIMAQTADSRPLAARWILRGIFAGGLLSLSGFWFGAQFLLQPEPDPESLSALQTGSLLSVMQPVHIETPQAAAPEPLKIELTALYMNEGGAATLIGEAPAQAIIAIKIDTQVIGHIKADQQGIFAAQLEPISQQNQSKTRHIQLIAYDDTGKPIATSTPLALMANIPAATQPEKPPAARPEPLSIETIAYNDTGAAVITGRGAAGQEAWLYLDGSLSAQGLINPKGDWQITLPADTPAAVYQLRVDQINAAGIISSQATTPFERAPEPEALSKQQTIVVQPGNNLWRIATRIYGDGHFYQLLYSYNKAQIEDPDRIFPGQVLLLPQEVLPLPQTEG